MGCCCLLLEPHLSGRIPVLWAMGHGPQDALTAVAVVKNHKTTHMINCADTAIGGFFYVLGILEVSCWPTKHTKPLVTCHLPLASGPCPKAQDITWIFYAHSSFEFASLLISVHFSICCTCSHKLALSASWRPAGGQLANYSTNFPICGPCQSDINIAFNWTVPMCRTLDLTQ